MRGLMVLLAVVVLAAVGAAGLASWRDPHLSAVQRLYGTAALAVAVVLGLQMTRTIRRHGLVRLFPERLATAVRGPRRRQLLRRGRRRDHRRVR